jgi:hypothetical protein
MMLNGHCREMADVPLVGIYEWEDNPVEWTSSILENNVDARGTSSRRQSPPKFPFLEL